LQESFRLAVEKDGWWQVAAEGKTPDFELQVQGLTTETTVSGSIRKKAENSKEREREASSSSVGRVRFKLIDTRTGAPTEHDVQSAAQVASVHDMPKEMNTKSFFPVLGLVLGIDPEQDRIQHQDMMLKMESTLKLQQNLGPAMLSKFTPRAVTDEVELDDTHQDIDPVVQFVRASDFESAQRYLELLRQSRNRGYVIYNLAVIKEAQGARAEACQLYQAAWEKKPKRLYLQQKAACETRLGHNSRVGL
jgi:hypothetical protein